MENQLDGRVQELVDEYFISTKDDSSNYNDGYYHDRYSDRYDDRYDDYDDNRYHDAR